MQQPNAHTSQKKAPKAAATAMGEVTIGKEQPSKQYHKPTRQQGETLKAALFFAEQKHRVFPCKESGKEPMLDNGLHGATTDEPQIRKWFKGAPLANLGIATSSALFVLDVDGEVGFDSLRKLEADNGKLPETWTVKTGNGGSHYYFTTKAGVEIRNSASKLARGLDIRGEGGYVIAPPSIHPNGNRYEWENSPEDTPHALAPDWLVRLIQNPKQSTPTPAVNTSTGTFAHLEAEPSRILESARLYLRDAIQKATNGNRNETGFHLALQLRDCGLKEMDAAPLMREYQEAVCNSGDHVYTPEEAILALGQAFKRTPREPALHGHHSEQTGTQEENGDTGSTTAAFSTLDEFQKTEPVTFEDFPTPPFPPGTLEGNDWLSPFIVAQSETLQVPKEFTAFTCFGVVSSILMGRVKVRNEARDWTEHANLYLMSLLPPSERKSPTLERCLRPLLDLERQARKLHFEQSDKAKSQRKALEAKEKKLTSKLEREDLEPVALDATKAELQSVLEQMDALPPKHAPQWIADDSTAEAIVDALEMNGERLSIFSAESKLLKNITGLYSGGIANFDILNKAYPVEPYSVNRRGREPQFLENPMLTICLTIQPGAFNETRQTKAVTEEGFLARFLYLVPNSKIGFRKTGDAVPVMPDDIREQYHQGIQTLHSNALQVPPHWKIFLSSDARSLFNAFEADVERRKRDGGDLNEWEGCPLAFWSGKLAGNVLRLALVLHAIKTLLAPDSLKTPISGETMEQAIALGEFFIPHARKAFGELNADESIRGAKQLLNWIRNGKRPEFLHQVGWQALKKTLNTGERYNSALNTLKQRGYLFEIGKKYLAHRSIL
jgi:hypothetical protein